MAKLHAMGRVKIKVFGRDHRPAHFHVIAPTFEALVQIESSAILRGMMPAAVRRDVLAWAANNRVALVAEWNRCNPDIPL